ncbi:MAG: hypothetical protein IPM64_11315 [Phycisphaerales bacterium]|nr:hypothetical protein [Phycisphaerales bacterium]
MSRLVACNVANCAAVGTGTLYWVGPWAHGSLGSSVSGESGSPSPCQACWDARETWGDMNDDGEFNNFDLDPFVSVLVGGASSPSYKTYV